MRAKVIAGNWKMNGSLAANAALVKALAEHVAVGSKAKLVVCAPFPYLAQLQVLLNGSPIELGAQNLSEYSSGAHTGEVSGHMLADSGCRYVIVGHSERRTLFGETDVTVAAKTVAALASKLVPIVCVGEMLAEREAGVTKEVVVRQLDAVLSAVPVDSLSSLVIAYEPVWAIGTGRTATPEQAQEVHGWIRQRFAEIDTAVAARVPILYGGSMKPSNASDLLAQPDIDGGLIGGASLVASDFLAIAAAVK